MSIDVNSALVKNEVSEAIRVEFYFSNYFLIAKSERINIFYNLIGKPTSLAKLESKFKDKLFGIYVKLADKVRLDENVTFVITEETEVCVFYKDYRLKIMIDLTKSMLCIDSSQRVVNIDKIELYLSKVLEVAD